MMASVLVEELDLIIIPIHCELLVEKCYSEHVQQSDCPLNSAYKGALTAFK